ncbi:MAG: hypothetical protein IJ435_03525 [Clostridia bacterium]|nr:hypothetical protein [Clostridia bacterium]
MVDSAIITMLDKIGNTIGDFELPLKIPMKELGKKLVALLKAMDSDRYVCLEKIKIEYNGKILDEEDTLYQNAVWDGSVIKLIY